MAISLELILGLWGSITGTVGVLILVLRYLKEKPKIESELIDAKHYYENQAEKEKDYLLRFFIQTRVRNKGDRGTTIGEAVLDFTIGKKHHRITQDYIVLSDGSKGKVDPNDMVKVRPGLEILSSYDKDPKQEEIPFNLVLYHTHGEIKLEGISKIG